MAKSNSPRKKAAASPAPADLPTVDTSRAASDAARLLANRALLKNAQGTGRMGASAFQQFKQAAARPATQALNDLLGGPTNVAQHAEHHLNKQVAHNQTFGADVNRKNIPRRTSGG